MEGVPGMLWYLLAVAFVVAGVLMSLWFALLAHWNRVRALDILKSYAERGEEPPAAVLAALAIAASTPTHGHTPHAPSAPPGRRVFLDQFILNTCLGLAAAGIAWWRIADGGGPVWLEIAAVIVAAGFGAGAVAGLIVLLTWRGRDA